MTRRREASRSTTAPASRRRRLALRALLVIAPLVLAGGGAAMSAAAAPAQHSSASSHAAAATSGSVDAAGTSSGVSAAGISSVSRSGKHVTVGFDIAPTSVKAGSGARSMLCSATHSTKRMSTCGTSVTFSVRSSCTNVSAFWATTGARASTTVGTCAE